MTKTTLVEVGVILCIVLGLAVAVVLSQPTFVTRHATLREGESIILTLPDCPKKGQSSTHTFKVVKVNVSGLGARDGVLLEGYGGTPVNGSSVIVQQCEKIYTFGTIEVKEGYIIMHLYRSPRIRASLP